MIGGSDHGKTRDSVTLDGHFISALEHEKDCVETRHR
jgi:hypothetical protein